MAQSDACPTGDPKVASSMPARSGNIFVDIDREFFSVILSLPLIQEGQLSVSDDCEYVLVNC